MPTVASPLGHPTGPKLLHAHEASIHQIHNASVFINIMHLVPAHPPDLTPLSGWVALSEPCLPCRHTSFGSTDLGLDLGSYDGVRACQSLSHVL